MARLLKLVRIAPFCEAPPPWFEQLYDIKETMTERLKFGEVPAGFMSDTCVGLPDWADAYDNQDTLEAEQIQQFLNRIGIIKPGQEIGVWAINEEIRHNRSLLTYFSVIFWMAAVEDVYQKVKFNTRNLMPQKREFKGKLEFGKIPEGHYAILNSVNDEDSDLVY